METVPILLNLVDCIPQWSNHRVQGEIEITSKVGSFYGSMCAPSAAQPHNSILRLQPVPCCRHTALCLCVSRVFLGVENRSQNLKLSTKNTWKLIEASKTSSFGYCRNANFPLHKSRASIRCFQISSHLLFLLGYVLP